ncbi:unnamed protein product [Mytilus coruscus]|uniref:DNA-directed DNA polymerase n=1 Tax=Mytilus coruscus TaxID=42192 RepID=A0A6J8D487_MYTCO|nr:unnamed protein product [Mytilus coruscus]
MHTHGQTGRGQKRKGQENYGPPMKRKFANVDNPEEMYTILVMGEHRMPKFNTTSTRYKVTVKDLDIRGVPNILKSLKVLFDSIIKNITEFMEPSDLVRLSVQCPELDFPISLPFIRLSQLHTERLLSEIERVLQSYEQFVLDETLEIELIHCYKTHDSDDEDWIYCNDCNRYFKSAKCNEMHKQETSTGKSTCYTNFRCRKCNQSVYTKLHKTAHKCGEHYCNTCKEYVPEEHKCYMLPSCSDNIDTVQHDAKAGKNEKQQKKKYTKTFIFFTLNEMVKGFFPHLFNTQENQHTNLPNLPELKFYNPDGMTRDKGSTFMEWYEEHKNDPFNLQEELLKYCRSYEKVV